MEYSCLECPQKDNHSFPSIVVSIIDEFNGVVYDKFCNYQCAINGTNGYFNAAASGSPKISAQVAAKYADFLPAAVEEAPKEDKELLKKQSIFEKKLLKFLNSSPDTFSLEEIKENVPVINNVFQNCVQEQDYKKCSGLFALWLGCVNNYALPKDPSNEPPLIKLSYGLNFAVLMYNCDDPSVWSTQPTKYSVKNRSISVAHEKDKIFFSLNEEYGVPNLLPKKDIISLNVNDIQFDSSFISYKL